MTENLATIIIAVGGALAAGIYIFKRVRQAARWVDRLESAVAAFDDLKELLDTVKTDVPGMAVSIGHLQRQFDELSAGLASDRRRLKRLVLLGAQHHPDAAHEYLQEDQ